MAYQNSGQRRKSNNGFSASEFIGSFKISKGEMDTTFLLMVIALLAFGLIMQFSASGPRGVVAAGDGLYYFKGQLLYGIVGLGIMWAVSKIDYHSLIKYAPLILLVSIVLLILVLIPGIGQVRNGARRWLIFFQPSEVAKFAIILFLAVNLTKNQDVLPDFMKGLLPYLVLIGIIGGLLLLEPHFSCMLIIVATAAIMIFVAGAKIKHFVGLVLLGLPAALFMIIQEPYRLARLVSFVNPFADKQGSGWQIVQSLYAIGSGGIFGVGLGKSRQKYLSLPEPHNDFIYSVLSEELGLVGAVLVIAMFAFLFYRGFKIATKAPDLTGTLLVVGIISIIAIQTVGNIAVVTASMPVTGMPLPFFSHGGTALIINLAEMGIVLNVSRQTKLL